GEREMAVYNKTLGKFHLVGIPPAPRGIPKVEVTFDIDANGIVNVSAKDLATSKEQQITITASTTLAKDEVNQMVKEAEKYADEDKKRREEADARNNADSLIYQTEKNLKEYGDKVPAGEKQNMQEALDAAKKALEGGDTERIKSTTEQLMQVSHKLAQVMYEQAASQQQAAGGGEAPPPPGGDASGGDASGGGDDGVVDAEYEDIGDKK
ncbi:MAG: Hsp70 family protein, partial [bacterium]